MDRITAEILCKLTDDFYACNAESFSRTRSGAWSGWERVLRATRIVAGADKPAQLQPLEEGLFGNAQWPLTVLDVACGNMRFARFLRERLPSDAQLEYFGVDNCDELVPGEEELANTMPFARFEKVDVLQRLLHEADLVDAIEAPACQLVACFALMHHVPGQALRANLLDALVRCAKPGGYVVASFWQFLDDADYAASADAQHAAALAAIGIAEASLDAGDRLLGWQGAPIGEAGSIRYCHSFSDADIDVLLSAVAQRARVVDRFSADGRTGTMNAYTVLQVL